MADKSIGELLAATSIGLTDLFVLEQNNVAKKLSGQTLTTDLAAMLDGHGGISSIEKTNSEGISDTYTITYADTSTTTFTLTNGNGITSAILNTDYTLTLNFSDGTSYTTPSIRGETGVSNYAYIKYAPTEPDSNADMSDTPDAWMGIYVGQSATAPTAYTAYTWYKIKGDSTYTYVRYAAEQPTASTPLYTNPNKWMGIYVGTAATAPTVYTEYQWYLIKGDKGDKGDSVTVSSTVTTYQAGSSGTAVPSGDWTTTIPTVAQGAYLWTRVVTTFSDNTVSTSYSVGRMGLDGTGSVSSVNQVSPDASGNVTVGIEDISGLPDALNSAGSVKTVNSQLPDDTGNVSLGVANIPGLQTALDGKQDELGAGDVSTEMLAADAVTAEKLAAGAVTAEKLADSAKALTFTITLTAAGWSGNTQTVSNANFLATGYKYDVAPAPASFITYGEAIIYCENITTDGQATFVCQSVPTVALTVNIGRTVAV